CFANKEAAPWCGRWRAASKYHLRKNRALGFREPVPQGRLMQHRIELGDPGEAHFLRFGERLLRQQLLQFRKRVRPRDQKSAARRNLRPGAEEMAVVIALLQERTMRLQHVGKLLERHQILTLQHEMLHRRLLVLSAAATPRGMHVTDRFVPSALTLRTGLL